MVSLIDSDYKINLFSLKGLRKPCKVVYCYDGDTVHLVCNFNEKLTRFVARLINIDAPEIRSKVIENYTKAIKARNYLLEQVSGKNIENIYMKRKEIIKFCASSKNIVWVEFHRFDKYGRVLVEIFKDEDYKQSINKKMIIDNYAKLY